MVVSVNKNVKNFTFTINFFSFILIINIMDICLYNYTKFHVLSMREIESTFYVDGLPKK